MATVDALSGTTSNTVSASAGGLSALTSEDFAKIIFAELGKQDPLQPSDTKPLASAAQACVRVVKIHAVIFVVARHIQHRYRPAIAW